MEDITSCIYIKKCDLCDEDNLTFNQNCPEYKVQDNLNTTYSSKTIIKNAESII